MDFSLSDEKNLFDCVNTQADKADLLTLNASDLPNVESFSVTSEMKEVAEKEDRMLSIQNKIESLDSSSVDASKTEAGASESDSFSLSNNVNTKQNEPLNKKSKSKRFECYECNKIFPSFAEVATHLKLTHNACAYRDCSKVSNFKLHSPGCVNRGLGCSICNQIFRDKHLLLVHFYDHIGAAFYACEECREGFQLRRDLQKHFFQTHNKFLSIPITPSQSKTLYQKCNHCSKYFKLFAEFEEHVSSCKPSTYACYFCSVGFASSSALEDHKLTEHKNDQVLKGNVALKEGKRYFCGICYIGFSKGGILKEHVLTHETNVSYICDVCHRKFPCDNDLQEHYLEHIEEHYILHDVISQYLCSTCQRTFRTQKELKDHLQLKSCKNNPRTDLKRLQAARTSLCGNYAEQLAKKNNGETMMDMSPDFSSIPVYVLKVGEDLLNCDDSECVIVMDLTSLFVLQRGMCASENRMPDVKNSEVYTETEVVDASLLENHMLQILCPAVSINGFNDPENVSNFQDAVECIVDSTSGNLETIIFDLSEAGHEPGKNESDKMQVESISVSEKNKNQLESEKYEFLVYDGLNKIADEASRSIKAALLSETKECMKEAEFLDAEELLENEDEVGISGLYICNICKQVFSSKTSLCLHVRGSHTGFDCYNCGESFSSDIELKEHENNVHPSSFQCDLCDVSFNKEHLLKKHKCSAHDGQIFYCNICNKSYALKNEFEVHMMLHKGETPPTQCEECGKIYASVSNYERHKAMHESKETPKKYICTICDKAFAEHSSLKIHLGSHMRKAPYSYECPKCKMYFPPKVLAKHVESHVDIVS